MKTKVKLGKGAIILVVLVACIVALYATFGSLWGYWKKEDSYGFPYYAILRYYESASDLKRGDYIVTWDKANNAYSMVQVACLPGDTLRVLKSGHITCNDTFITPSPSRTVFPEDQEIVIPAHHYFLFTPEEGYNDSRSCGLIPSLQAGEEKARNRPIDMMTARAVFPAYLSFMITERWLSWAGVFLLKGREKDSG